MALTRLKVCPLRSKATIVFSKLGAAGFWAALLISARFSAMAACSAGLKSATLTLSKGGTPPAGPVQGLSSGLTFIGADCDLETAPKTLMSTHATAIVKRPNIGQFLSGRHSWDPRYCPTYGEESKTACQILRIRSRAS